jgi:hypothetical protein
MNRQATTQQVTWFLDLERSKQLELSPPYQRRSVWSPKDRRYFLDTIFRNYPTPPIFMHRTVDDTGFTMYHVVDGKQRLETILQFAKDKIAIDPEFGDKNLDGRKFSALEVAQKRKFWDYTLVVEFIETVEGKSIDEVFNRINKNARNLLPQELRHARYNGWFINEVENENEDEFWWNLKINTHAKDKRMKNEQFISELLIILLTMKIVGFSQDYLDDMYSLYDGPEETITGFDEEDYRAFKNDVKSYIKQMEAKNKVVSTQGKSAIHFYTLWAMVALNLKRLPDSATVAEKYATFMELVNKLGQASNPEDLMTAKEEQQRFELPFKYFKNSKGASTDLPQRVDRLASLTTFIIP